MGQTRRQSLERRSFLKCVAMATAALPFSGGGIDASGVPARQPPAGTWASQIGFALFTVRDLLAKDADGTMAALAKMGIREVQPRTYLGLEHGAFRALLDRHGLSCRSTHEFLIPGPGLEREFESLQKIGIKYARFPVPGQPIPGSGGGRGAGEGRGSGGGDVAASTMVETPEMMRRVAADLNANGRLAAKYGIKALYHNHTTEFQRYPGEPLLPYEVLLRETDPALVAMEIDLGHSRFGRESQAHADVRRRPSSRGISPKSQTLRRSCGR